MKNQFIKKKPFINRHSGLSRIRSWMRSFLAYQDDVSSQGGQIIVIVVLILLVLSLVILAVASRSITGQKIAQTNDDSTRAFSAAEAGVETAVEQIKTLGDGAVTADPQTATFANGATYSYTVSKTVKLKSDFLAPTRLASDLLPFQVNLEGYTAGTICLFWGNPDITTDLPGIEAVILYGPAGSLRSERVIFSPGTTEQCGDHPGNKSTNNNLGVERTFTSAKALTLPANPKLLRLHLMYTRDVAHYIGVGPTDFNTSLPSQGYTIDAEGTVAISKTTRRIKVFRSFPALPAVFDYVLFNGSGQSIVKE